MVYVIAAVVVVIGLTGSKAWAIVTLVVGLLSVYPVSCWLDPWTDCICCKGSGKHYRNRKNSTRHRHCRWCKRAGERLRWGRRIYNRYKKARG